MTDSQGMTAPDSLRRAVSAVVIA